MLAQPRALNGEASLSSVPDFVSTGTQPAMRADAAVWSQTSGVALASAMATPLSQLSGAVGRGLALSKIMATGCFTCRM